MAYAMGYILAAPFGGSDPQPQNFRKKSHSLSVSEGTALLLLGLSKVFVLFSLGAPPLAQTGWGWCRHTNSSTRAQLV